MKAILLSISGICLSFFAQAQWATSSTNIYNSNSGNVGIGTGATISEKFHVNGNARANQFNSINGIFNSLNTTSMSLQTNGTARVTILNSNGFTGINTNSPTEFLHVNGNVKSNQFITTNGTLNSVSSILALQTNGTSRITILNSNGHVGIGLSNPAYMLDVSGTLNATAIRVGGTPIVPSQWATSGTNIYYNLGGVVSIGTTAAPTGFKLAVAGKIIAEEIVVKLQANWADYVFEDDYKLSSLAEVKQYIKKHKHLPGIPSAKEVEENGITVGEMNTLLLKKIEELTLYIIQQNEEIESLKRKIN